MNKLTVLTGAILFTTASIINPCLADKKLNQHSVIKGPGPRTISLAGQWQFKLDPANEGVKDKWFNMRLDETIRLPGTTDEAHKGIKNTRSEAGRLTRVYQYYGPAWYQQEATIPKDWSGKHITFLMERTKTTRVWVDSTLVGSQITLAGMQRYDLSAMLTPGKHRISVMINNKEIPPVGDPHQISDQTQTNWNGIIGRIELKATDAIWMNDVQLFPNVNAHTVTVKIKFGKRVDLPVNGKIAISAKSWNVAKSQTLPAQVFDCKADTGDVFSITYHTGNNIQLWNEFSPALYKFNITFSGTGKSTGYKDNAELNTGLRDFTAKATNFAINGKIIFIRGKHDACVFPLTGYPPMTVDGWLRIFRIAKSYGLNTYRFHTWCPPEAAFSAADIAGFYLQPELPIWGSIGRPTEVRKGDVEQHIDNDPIELRTQFLLAEGHRMLQEYGNHSSFVMFSLGNELTGSKEVMANMEKQFRDYDNRHLYAQGSNNFLNNPQLPPADDYWTTTMTGGHYTAGNYRIDTRDKDVRSSYPVDTVGHLNNKLAGTEYNYSESIKGIPVPVIGHEIGQYQTYPNYKEITKYTGVVQARNFEIFKKRLDDAGMGDQADAFFKASGALAVLCYREEIETALRTPGFGGFHLLDLQDYPGQGTALVGILDAFMDSKGLITPEKWREFCNPTVALVKMKSYIWTNAEIFTADAEIANYGPDSYKHSPASWTLANDKGEIVWSGKLPAADIKQGAITSLGKIEANLQRVTSPQKLTLTLRVAKVSNSYPVWVFPQNNDLPDLKGITISDKLDKNALSILQNGGSVLLFPKKSEIKKSVAGVFQADFWSYTMFKKYSPPGTLGILCNSKSPALAGFPTESHSNWQWWRLVRGAPSMVLDSLPKSFRPTVQVIDNLERNHKLGLVFEAKVGNGKLMVCSIDLPGYADYPEAKDLEKSLLNYMQTPGFNPAMAVDLNTLQKVFRFPESQ